MLAYGVKFTKMIVGIPASHSVLLTSDPRPVFLLSAARPGRYLKFSLKISFSYFFLRKTDPQSSNYFKYRT